MTASRLRQYLVVFVGAIAALWLVGLWLFVMHIESLNEPVITPSMEATDAIVVLTGGSERLSTGLELLSTGKAKKLFISGVHPGLSLDHIIGNQPIAPRLRSCCVILGHVAETTIGNADETRTWLALENYNSLRLVTANYHMPRSLMLFHATMPDIQIIPHPISPDSVNLAHWWDHSGTARLLVNEYNKYLWAAVRLQLGWI